MSDDPLGPETMDGLTILSLAAWCLVGGVLIAVGVAGGCVAARYALETATEVLLGSRS